MDNRKVHFLLMVAATVLLCSCDTASIKSPSSPKTDADFAQAAQTFQDKGRCGKQWDVLWPLAKDGDGRALAQLASDLFIGDLEPPGDGKGIDRGARKRAHAFTLGVYAANAKKHPNRENLRFFVQDELSSQQVTVLQAAGGKLSYSTIDISPASRARLGSCYGAKFDAKTCLAAAGNAKLIPSFTAYSSAMDNELKSRRNDCFRSYL